MIRQIERLLVADWSDPEGVVRLNRSLPAESLEGIAPLENARILLESIREKGSLPATERGNLARIALRGLLERVHLPEEDRHTFREDKYIREWHMWPVHWVRLLLELGGCIRRRQGAFRLTRKGRSLLDGPPAQLFALLFETNFRRFDLAYRFGAEWPELQIQVPFTLYRIWSLPAEWRTAPVLLRETVLQIPPPPEAASLAHLPALLFDSRIMSPLVDFGLIATRTEPRSREDHCLLRVSYRRTSLMRAFLHFEPSRL